MTKMNYLDFLGNTETSNQQIYVVLKGLYIPIGNPLDEAVASRAVVVIVLGRADKNAFGAS